MPLEDPNKGLKRLDVRPPEFLPIQASAAMLPELNQAGIQAAIAGLSQPAPEKKDNLLRTILQVGAPLLSVALGSRAPLLAGFTSGFAQGMSDKDLREQAFQMEEAERTQQAIQRLTEIGFEADLREQGAGRRHTRELEQILKREGATLQRQKEYETFKRQAGAAGVAFDQDIERREIAVKERQAATDARRETRLDREGRENVDKIPAPPIARTALGAWPKVQAAKRKVDELRAKHKAAKTKEERELLKHQVEQADAKLDEAAIPVMELAETYGLSFRAARGLLFDVGRGKINENDLGELLQDILAGEVDPIVLDNLYKPKPTGPIRITPGDL